MKHTFYSNTGILQSVVLRPDGTSLRVRSRISPYLNEGKKLNFQITIYQQVQKGMRFKAVKHEGSLKLLSLTEILEIQRELWSTLKPAELYPGTITIYPNL